jgi:hypothetical protein
MEWFWMECACGEDVHVSLFQFFFFFFALSGFSIRTTMWLKTRLIIVYATQIVLALSHHSGNI